MKKKKRKTRPLPGIPKEVLHLQNPGVHQALMGLAGPLPSSGTPPTGDQLFGQAGEDIAAVEPADVEQPWKIFDSSPRNTAIGVDLLERACSPGANVRAVIYRVGMLRLLQFTKPELLVQWRQGDSFHPSLFAAAARIKMSRMELGKTYKTLPFDVDEFLREVAA